MTVSVNWMNPYEKREGNWYRGNLHTHTSPASGCGTVPMERVLDLYAKKGIDFLVVSDHMCLSEPQHESLNLIPGIEWNAKKGGEHTGLYSFDKELLLSSLAIEDHEELLAHFAGKDALVILNHPNWQFRPHYRREELEAKQPYDGIEIFNQVIERLSGYAISTDKWDFLLSKGRRVLGFANDDSHNENDIGQAWNCVRAAEPTPEAILQSLRQGNFYCSTGVTISDIRVENRVITLETENAQEIRAIGKSGIIHKTHSASLSFSLPRMEEDIERATRNWTGSFDETTLKTSYVRFVAYGPGASMAWTQPFFLR